MSSIIQLPTDPQFLDVLQSVFDAVSAIEEEQDRLPAPDQSSAQIALQLSSLLASMKSAGPISMHHVVNTTDKDHFGSAKNLAAALCQIGFQAQSAYRKMFTLIDVDEYGTPMVEKVHVLWLADDIIICPALGCSHIGWPAIQKEHEKNHPRVAWSHDVYVSATGAGDPTSVNTLVDIIKRQQALHSRADIEGSLSSRPTSPHQPPHKKM